MARSRSIFVVLAGTAAMLLALLWIPSAARAAGNIAIAYVNNALNPYALQVEVLDGNGLQLTSMTVHLYSGTTDVYDITNMAYAAGSGSDQVWNAAAPIPEADIPVGRYTVIVDATDADETDLGLPAPESMNIVYSPTITASPSPVGLSYGDTNTTISGSVTGAVASPYNAPAIPLAGVPVDLYDEGTGITKQIATSHSDGTYSAQVQLPNAADAYMVVVASSPTMNGGGTSLPVVWMQDATELVSAQVTPSDFVYGSNQQATLTGTVEYDNAITGWQPLTNYPVSVNAGLTSATVYTDNLGHFTWTYIPQNATQWGVEVLSAQLFGPASASGIIHIAVPLQFASFSASLNSFAQLSVKACVNVTAPGFKAPHGRLTIQYSTTPTGPWTNLGTITKGVNSPRSCQGTVDSYYQRTFSVKLANAYYRAFMPGSVDYQAVASTPLHRWKYVTRIISMKVSPTVVHRGGKLTVSGRLQQWSGKWRNFSRQQILIILKPRGSKRWYWIRKVRTSSTGHFTSTFRDPVTASWSADYEGNSTHFASGGSVHHVTLESVVAAAGLSAVTDWHALPPASTPLTNGRVISALVRALA